MPVTHSSVLALDVGAKRVGVSVTSLTARLPRPLITLQWDDNFYGALQKIVEDEGVTEIVVGLPRGMQGQHTAQTQAIEDFTTELQQQLNLPIHYQDEALTSRHAEDELQARGKPYEKGDIDALAATYILEDYLNGQPQQELQS